MKLLQPGVLFGAAILGAVLFGCDESATQAGASDAAAPQTVYAANKLMGQWNGPEGTFLLLAGANGKYAITIKNLDGPRTFQGTGTGDTIEFERDGKVQTIRASDGAATGMKWLGDKKDCVVIEPGEGYCRD